MTTQKTYKHPCEGDKRPDIVIELSDENSTSITFTESTIGSQEGWKQLNDYARVLNIKQFFLDALNTVEKIKLEYPHLPWSVAFEDDGAIDSEAE